MSVIKIGNKIVQSGNSGYQPKGVKTSTPQRRQLKTKNEIPDNRERYIANQAQKAANQQAQFLINQANRRSDVETAMRFAPETVNRSEFTGNKGDGLFGLNINATPTNIPKLREGLSSDEYANYMRGLYSINPSRMETMFPFASGKRIRDVSRFLPGIGTLQNFAGAVSDKTGDVIQGLKEIAMNKGIIPRDNLNEMGTTAADPASTDTLGMNQNVDPDALQAPELAKFLSPQDMGFSSPLGRFVPNPQDMGITAQPGRFVQNPQDMNIQPKMTAKDYFNDLSPDELDYVMGITNVNPMDMNYNMAQTRNLMKQGFPVFGEGALEPIMDPAVPVATLREQITGGSPMSVGFNEGGLASINNPEYNMLMNASNFDL